jgi:hypothetical protein
LILFVSIPIPTPCPTLTILVLFVINANPIILGPTFSPFGIDGNKVKLSIFNRVFTAYPPPLTTMTEEIFLLPLRPPPEVMFPLSMCFFLLMKLL